MRQDDVPEVKLSIPDEFVDAIARRIAAAIEQRLTTESREAGWLNAKAAALYLGLPSINALHKLTASRELPFSQTSRGAPCYFRRSDLDRYREQFMRGAAG